MLSNNTEEVAQNKLIILYILKNTPNFLTNNELTEFILDKGYMNYFALQQYLSELTEGVLIVLKNEKYILLNKGVNMLELFKSKIPENVIQELTDEFKLQKQIVIKETQVIGDYYKKENDQYSVNLKLVENDETLFSLYFDVATEEQGERVSRIWKKDTQSIYKNIMDLFIIDDN